MLIFTARQHSLLIMNWPDNLIATQLVRVSNAAYLLTYLLYEKQLHRKSYKWCRQTTLL